MSVTHNLLENKVTLQSHSPCSFFFVCRFDKNKKILYINHRGLIMREQIKSILQFYGFDEFYKRRFTLRYYALKLSCDDRYAYRDYIYTTPFVSDSIRNAMWDYLMMTEPDEQLDIVYNKYKNKKKK